MFFCTTSLVYYIMTPLICRAMCNTHKQFTIYIYIHQTHGGKKKNGGNNNNYKKWGIWWISSLRFQLFRFYAVRLINKFHRLASAVAACGARFSSIQANIKMHKVHKHQPSSKLVPPLTRLYLIKQKCQGK